MRQSAWHRDRVIGWLCMAAALAVSAGCVAAPLEGKSCPCTAGFTCCNASLMCVADGAQCPPPVCSIDPSVSPIITVDGSPLPVNGSPPPPNVTFGTVPNQWISYTYGGAGEEPPTLEATAAGDGFQVVAKFTDLSGAADAYEGVGLTFASPNCIDGRQWTGLQFDVAGDLGGRLLAVGVTSSDDLGVPYDPIYERGTCTAGASGCFGPTKQCRPPDPQGNPVRHFVPFDALMSGKPHGELDPSHIVNVQWQLTSAANPMATFTVTNVRFY